MSTTIETFDQRFKRLTSDMLMIDICRLLDIEIRQLMKIRSGQRIELGMNGLRRLCMEQGLDFNSFIRGYDEPWSSELQPSQVITSDEPVAIPVAAGKTTGPLFRPDGSRITREKPAPMPSVKSKSEPPPETPPASSKKLQVSFRPTKSAPSPTVPEKYTTTQHDDFVDDFVVEENDVARPNIASRLRNAVSSAFRRSDAESEQVELYGGVAPARVLTSSEPPRALAKADEPRAITRTGEIEGLISEVAGLRHEISDLKASVRRLLDR
jgi:hypothetical protein